MIDVPKVHFNAIDHLLEPAGFAPQPIDLRPPGYARLDVMTTGVFRDQHFVLVIVRQRMRTRPYKRHIALENIEELGQLIHAGLPQELADASDPAIVAARLRDGRPILLNGHRAELENHELS